ncbi:MAG: polysaccharide deacetylase family protein [Methylocystis sp.]|uniref:polysaccharide deacetylase family protein n=1 Tax=Methylocystis sp. TaxID=1911079 RepID=UPI003D14C399
MTIIFPTTKKHEAPTDDAPARRFARALLAFASIALISPQSVAAEERTCGPEALGVSRVIEIDRANGTAVGLQSYPRTLDLRDHEVVLTFDDGPAPTTAKVLDALAKQCARATFFLIGRNAEGLPALVKRAAADGHSIGHHSYSHPDKTLRLMSEEAAKADIDKGIAAVNKALGATAAPFFRFPGYADTPALVAYLNGRGYTIFGSDLWASDWAHMTSKAELELVLSRLEKSRKGIVLFHDSQAITAEMLPEFLRQLKKRGYALVHITPGDAATPIVAAGPGWTSTTEPIIAKTLGRKGRLAPHAHEQGAREAPKSAEP